LLSSKKNIPTINTGVGLGAPRSSLGRQLRAAEVEDGRRTGHSSIKHDALASVASRSALQ
jgi:hypothetical protein